MCYTQMHVHICTHILYVCIGYKRMNVSHCYTEALICLKFKYRKIQTRITLLKSVYA